MLTVHRGYSFKLWLQLVQKFRRASSGEEEEEKKHLQGAPESPAARRHQALLKDIYTGNWYSAEFLSCIYELRSHEFFNKSGLEAAACLLWAAALSRATGADMENKHGPPSLAKQSLPLQAGQTADWRLRHWSPHQLLASTGRSWLGGLGPALDPPWFPLCTYAHGWSDVCWAQHVSGA